MAKEENQTGKDVRRAMDGPDIDHDALISFAADRNKEDKNRASSAGESRQKIGDFLEKTGMNSQALSWSRSILKKLDKNEGQAKAMDVISSLKKVLPMIEAHVRGQGQGTMDLDEEPVEPFDGDAGTISGDPVEPHEPEAA